MKRVVVTIAVLLCVTMMITGADLRLLMKMKKPASKKHCIGYTIIEADKGIDCNGDTVKLTKAHGYYQVANQ